MIRRSRRARDSSLSALPALAALVPVFVILGVFYIVPLGRAAHLSFSGPGWFFSEYWEFFSTPEYRKIFQTTLYLSLATTGACLVLGYPVAYVLATARNAPRNLLFVVILVPWLLAELVRAFAWVVILQPEGALSQLQQAIGLSPVPIIEKGTTSAMFVAMLYVELPLAVLPLYAIMSRIDLSLIGVAESLGATRVRAVWRVLLPLSVPGLFAAGILVFLTSLGFFIVPALVGGTSDIFMANLIEVQASKLVDWEASSAAAVSLTLAGVAAMAITARFVGWSWLIEEHGRKRGPAADEA